MQTFVDEIDIPGFIDDATFYGALSDNVTDTGSRSRVTADSDSSSAAGGSAVPVPDFDGAVISVFAIAVILLILGQLVVVCRQRHRRSCRRRCRKWNVPAFDHLHGLTPVSHTSGQVLHSPPPSEVWTALPSSPLSDLFHADNYRTAAFAYINRRSTDSLPSTAAAASPSGSSGSSTAAIYVRRPGSSVTWSDVGEMTSSSPEKQLPTSLSLTSSSCGAVPSRLDAEAQTEDDGEETAYDDQPSMSMATTNDAAFAATSDDDVNITSSSASVSISPSHSLRGSMTCNESVFQHQPSSFGITVDHSDGLEQAGDDSDYDPVSPTSTDLHYIELTTDCSTAVHPDTDNSTC